MKKYFALFASLIVVIVTAYSQDLVKHSPAGCDSSRNGIEYGKIDYVSYLSKTVGTYRKKVIYLPPYYSKDRKYPLLYLLHDIGGDEKEWVERKI